MPQKKQQPIRIPATHGYIRRHKYRFSSVLVDLLVDFLASTGAPRRPFGRDDQYNHAPRWSEAHAIRFESGLQTGPEL